VTTAATSDSVLAEIGRRRIVAVVRAESASEAVAAVRALGRGGISAVEIAFTTPAATEAISELVDDGDILVGAGTVENAEVAAAACDAGAQYLVSPFLCSEVVELADERGVLAIPGVLTPTEIAAAASRASLLKLFPASIGGPAMLRTLRGPFPALRFMPTGGVNLSNLRDWFGAGAFAVGAGTDLCPSEAVSEGDFALLEHRARCYSAELRSLRLP
jgi:2-dehydro-3-deoxyphosphogluconate aldolase/(4S)-4-hydroxy-2-oxoglutarate aldolase